MRLLILTFFVPAVSLFGQLPPPASHPGVEFITPAGDPVNNPTESGDGQNEFTFSTASPGLLQIPLKIRDSSAGNTPSSSPYQYKFEFSGSFGDSTMNWDSGYEGGQAQQIAGKKDEFEASVTFTTLPSDNSGFGQKTVKLFRRKSPYEDYKEMKSQKFEVFFPRDKTNFPENGPYLGPRPPNWFFYWGKIDELSAKYDLVFRATNPDRPDAAGYTDAAKFWDWTGPLNKKRISIVKLASGEGESYNAQGSSTSGIDCFISTVKHESRHVWQIHEFDKLVPDRTHGRPWANGWSFSKGYGNHYGLGIDGAPGFKDVDDDADGQTDNFFPTRMGEIGRKDVSGNIMSNDVSLSNNRAVIHDWPSSLTVPKRITGRGELEDDAVNFEISNHKEDDSKDYDWGAPGKNYQGERFDD